MVARAKWLFFILLSVALLGAADKKQKPKPAIVDIQEFKVFIDGSHVNIEGKIRNAGERKIEKLVLYFHFLDTERAPVTTLHMDVDPDEIDPNEDAEIHAEANAPARAVYVTVTAADHGERELKVLHPGPYGILD
jgi:hypothetical protein